MAGNRLRSLPALTNDERISGLILVGAIPEAIIESLLRALQVRHGSNAFPLVLVDDWFPRADGTPSSSTTRAAHPWSSRC